MERTLLRITILRESNSNTSNRIRILRGKRRPSRRKSARTTPSISPSTSTRRKRPTTWTNRVVSTASIRGKIRAQSVARRTHCLHMGRRSGFSHRLSRRQRRMPGQSIRASRRRQRRSLRFGRERRRMRGTINRARGIGRQGALGGLKKISTNECASAKKPEKLI